MINCLSVISVKCQNFFLEMNEAFLEIAQIVQLVANRIFLKIKNFVSSLYFWMQRNWGLCLPKRELQGPISFNASLKERMDRYAKMPKDPIAFFQKAIDLHRAQLIGEDNELPPKDRFFLKNFEDDIFDCLDVVYFMQILIRAFVFNDVEMTESESPKYFISSYFPHLVNVKLEYNQLSDEAKLLIHKNYNAEDPEKIPFPSDEKVYGENILSEIAGLSVLLVKDNPELARCTSLIK